VARDTYERRLAAGVAREQARKDLPLSTYTEAYWKVDLHNLLHFLQLRMDDHAQEEIRAYAALIGDEIVAKWVPIVWEAFGDYRRHALRLSRIELAVVSALASGSPDGARAAAESFGLLKTGSDGQLTPSRERRELEEKLRRLGFSVPWASTT
jgi:thymidylate synthase (FAD)